MSRIKKCPHTEPRTRLHPLWNEATRCLAAGDAVSHELKKKSAFIRQCDRQCRYLLNKMDIIIIILSNPPSSVHRGINTGQSKYGLL